MCGLFCFSQKAKADHCYEDKKVLLALGDLLVRWSVILLPRLFSNCLPHMCFGDQHHARCMGQSEEGENGP